jgi:hypothetical protein
MLVKGVFVRDWRSAEKDAIKMKRPRHSEIPNIELEMSSNFFVIERYSPLKPSA